MILNFPPPSNWQDFELLSLRRVEQICDPATVRVYGRLGQRQNGVDVYGETFDGRHIGVQCKKMQARESLTLKLIGAEADKAKLFLPALNMFVIATTLPEDTALHNAVIKLNNSNKYPFQISYWSWSHFNDNLNRSSRLVEESYRGYAMTFGAGVELLEVNALREAFDRPAFLDNFHYELNISDFLSALGDTILFLQTGYLRDRVSQQLLRGSFPLELLPAGSAKKLRTDLLRGLKELRANAIKDKKNSTLNGSRAIEYNARRNVLICRINRDLEAQNLPLIMPGY
ncbi:hypothetical protein [Sulfitobacter sp. CW3]|uniref:hypothetical protein n=1 Tax=Sulfitobacter sp. CW3 TaxID=2861965 RepID=UPI001C603F61|nr:hypothetical protein [Sulfitobacter sp. CW3]MBW4964056.1 hypothetical protein [Sulfitobacter sp. CW3]